MPYAGDLQITVEMTSNVGAGVAATKAQLGQLDGSVKESSNQMNILDAATGKNAKGIKSMGTVAMMAGGPLMMMGMSMKEAGGEAEKLSGVVTSTGMGLTAFGMVAMVLPPIIKAVGFAHSVVVPAIMAHTAATTTNTIATAAETVVIESNIAAKAVEVTFTEQIAIATAQCATTRAAATTMDQLAAISTAELAAAKTELTAGIVYESAAEQIAVVATGELAAAETVAVVPTVALAGAVDLLKIAIFGLAGGIIVGGLIAAYSMMSYAQTVSKKATEEHTQALKDQKTAQDELKQSLNSYNSLVDEYNNKDITASELKNAHTAAVLNLQEALKKAGQSGTPENLLAVSDAQNRVSRTQAAMDKGAARVGDLPGLINEAATKATAADSEAQNKIIIAKNIGDVEARWNQYKKENGLFGIVSAGSARREADELNTARIFPGVNVNQTPMMAGGLPANPAPTAIHIQNLTVGGIGETPIGDTGFMLKVERKRAV